MVGRIGRLEQLRCLLCGAGTGIRIMTSLQLKTEKKRALANLEVGITLKAQPTVIASA